jgi:hypothetical protein
MSTEYALRSFNDARPEEIEEALEKSEVVFFDRCPIELPPAEDLELLRTGLPGVMKAKNVSFHPESDSVPRFDAPPEIRRRVENILRTHGHRVETYLRRVLPDYVAGWTVGTTSFRPIEEQGRKLPPRSSNELVHIDAGAYGATNGARILRFFVNVNPQRERVWGTKGGLRRVDAKARGAVGRGARRRHARADPQIVPRLRLQRPDRRHGPHLPARQGCRFEPL